MNPELLAPAGSFEKMQYAFAYGADAVYAGAPQFSLRARENSFRDPQIAEGIEYAHARGKKFYLTVNIIGHNRKIKPFIKKIPDIIAARPDALIMADPGLIALVKEQAPEMEIHLSVQANAMNWATVKFWKSMGISRIILSRELSIAEISEIKQQVPEMELEVFVHGAICIAHSGRCLMSNFFENRDANDGCCNNACRWEYKTYAGEPLPNAGLKTESEYQEIKGDYFIESTQRPGEFLPIDEDEHGTYIMNAKDLMAIEYLEDLKNAGVDSFKIEGRSKSIYYLAMSTQAYRRAIDELGSGKGVNPEHLETLQKIHHRGYTPGFLAGRKSSVLQQYDSGHSKDHTQEFAGVVHAVEEGRIKIMPKNKLQVGDEIEIISPEKTVYTRIEQIVDDAGNSLESLHGGTQKAAWIPFAEAANFTAEHTLVSKRF